MNIPTITPPSPSPPPAYTETSASTQIPSNTDTKQWLGIAATSFINNTTTNKTNKTNTNNINASNGNSSNGNNSNSHSNHHMGIYNGNQKKEKGSEVKMTKALEKFAYYTTLHGMRHLASDVGLIRRVLWLVLFVLCAVVMSIQIVERIVYFYDYPTTVNVKVNFNKTLNFPALTICNQNAFRASASADNDVYRVIESFYSHDMNLLRIEDMMSSKTGAITLDKFYKMAAHRKEDFIVGCQWQDTECGPQNFTDTLTDHGACYSFNHHALEPLVVASAGSKYGLRLTLNVEQYEYMPGPHDAAGVKILLHDNKEFPQVSDLGLAIPTGTHAFVGMQLVKVENLAKPYGACKSDSSPYYSRYSTDACQLACFTEYMSEQCGCRDVYLPHINGSPPICTMKEYVGCYQDNLAKVKSLVRDNCDCPIPCNFRIYDPTISFASTSLYATERLLASTATEELHRKYIAARETTARIDKFKFDSLHRLFMSTQNRYDHLKIVLADLVRTHIRAQEEFLISLHQDMHEVWQRKKYLMEWQAYHVDKNFMRARQAMEERTLFFLALGFQEFSYQVEIRINQMSERYNNLLIERSNLTKSSNNSDLTGILSYENETEATAAETAEETAAAAVDLLLVNEDVKKDLYLQTMNMINGRIDLSDRAHANYTQLYEAYLNGTPIFRYKFYDEPREDNTYITPRPLLKDSLFRTAYTLKYSSRVGKDIKNIRFWLQKYSVLANKSFENGTVEWEDVHKANVMFLNRCRRFYHSKSTFYAESIEHPLRVMKENIADFERAWRNFDRNFQDMRDNVRNIVDRMTVLEKTVLHNLQDLISQMNAYIENRNVSKTQVAELLTSDELHTGMGNLKNFFHELRSRGQEVYDGWPALLKSANEIWRTVIEDENMLEYYQYKNMTDWMEPFENVSQRNGQDFFARRENYDFRFQIGHLDSLFLIEIQKLVDHMAEFKSRNRLDSRFINENYLQVDVFYREKSYEQIAQQSAYDIFALLCDVGGSMGLFVGASVLTMYELLDFAFHHSLLGVSNSRLLGWLLRKLGRKKTAAPVQEVFKSW